jgi:urate oxidase
MTSLGRNRYGKSGVRLVKVMRAGTRHELRDLTVGVSLEGDFVAAHVSGDNARILPTDTMKNTVYALAKDQLIGSIEGFALALSDHFLRNAPITAARVTITEHLWTRLRVNGQEHEHSFTRTGGEVRTARVRRTAERAQIRSGVRGLLLLKTTRSGFVGYIKDRFTTLPETTDRVFATALNAEWRYAETETETETDYDVIWHTAMTAITETFAQHDSLSVQHTLYAMGEKMLERCPGLARVRLTLPNKHHIPVDLSKFGLENRNEIFVATREPYGLIIAEVHRP